VICPSQITAGVSNGWPLTTARSARSSPIGLSSSTSSGDSTSASPTSGFTLGAASPSPPSSRRRGPALGGTHLRAPGGDTDRPRRHPDRLARPCRRQWRPQGQRRVWLRGRSDEALQEPPQQARQWQRRPEGHRYIFPAALWRGKGGAAWAVADFLESLDRFYPDVARAPPSSSSPPTAAAAPAGAPRLPAGADDASAAAAAGGCPGDPQRRPLPVVCSFSRVLQPPCWSPVVGLAISRLDVRYDDTEPATDFRLVLRLRCLLSYDLALAFVVSVHSTRVIYTFLHCCWQWITSSCYWHWLY